MKELERWLQYTDEETQKELRLALENEKEIEDRFYKALSFGTGGLRGIIGAGTNRMNKYTVGRATFGLADYLLETQGTSVVIAYDSRHKSAEFARVAAEIFSSKGLRVFLFPELTPTPVLSFAVRHLQASAGIVITASHNPKEYNGYKVYNALGCQITDDAAEAITEKIQQNEYFQSFTPVEENICILDESIERAFLDTIQALSMTKITDANAPTIVYSPLHGTGKKYVQKVLREMGVERVYTVAEQEQPSGAFLTCPYPNPEEKAALKLALRDAEKYKPDLVMATDPDADRIGIAVPNEQGEYVLLNGNETGSVLLYYILQKRSEMGIPCTNATVIKTIVTTDIVYGMACEYGVAVKEVLTGFKYIGEALENTDDYLFGLEESYGYLVGKHARDKDAVSAAMMLAEACAYFKEKGKGLYAVLQEIYARYGYYQTELKSISLPGKDGMEKMQRILSRIRQNPPTIIDSQPPTFDDFAQGLYGLPKSDVLRFANETYRIIVRPSGTEPKMKMYLQAKAETKTDALANVEKALRWAEALIAD